MATVSTGAVSKLQVTGRCQSALKLATFIDFKGNIMMKSKILVIGALLIGSLSSMVAAQAGSLPDCVNTPAGQLVCVGDAVSFDRTTAPAELIVTRKGVDANGQPVAVNTAYADAGNAAYTKLTTAATSIGYFKMGTTALYVNARAADYGNCSSGLSQFYYSVGIRNVFDNCAAKNAATGQAIQ